MSDLTIGKIVNNSVTLVLSSESADKARVSIQRMDIPS